MVAGMNIAIFRVATVVVGVNIAIFWVATVVAGVNIAIFGGICGKSDLQPANV